MDPTLEGRTAAPFTMLVEHGKVREFARATKSRNPDYDGAIGEPLLTPATFLASSAFWQGPSSSPMAGVARNLERVLHGEQEFVFHGTPPRVGDVLTGTARIDKVYEKEGKRGGTMSFIDLVVEFRDAEGRLVAESRSTSLETSKPATDDPA
jgi:hypothetical protein